MPPPTGYAYGVYVYMIRGSFWMVTSFSLGINRGALYSRGCDGGVGITVVSVRAASQPAGAGPGLCGLIYVNSLAKPDGKRV